MFIVRLRELDGGTLKMLCLSLLAIISITLSGLVILYEEGTRQHIDTGFIRSEERLDFVVGMLGSNISQASGGSI